MVWVDIAPIFEMCNPICVLGYLHEVEQRILRDATGSMGSRAKVIDYERRLRSLSGIPWSAAAAERIKALASVLRPGPVAQLPPDPEANL